MPLAFALQEAIRKDRKADGSDALWPHHQRSLLRALGNDGMQRLARSDLDTFATAPKGPSSALPRDVRRRLERALRVDLSDVRVHATQDSARRADALGAKAYAAGSDIHFGAGRYRPNTPDGLRLLSHEVSHVAQQKHSGADPVRLISRPGDASEHRADSFADSFTTGARSSLPVEPAGPATSVIQRDLLDAAGFVGNAAPASTALSFAPALEIVFNSVLASNLAVSTVVPVPGSWLSAVAEYSLANIADGIVLVAALARLPTFHRGGWIMSVVPGAVAMTLDRRVFDNGSLSLATCVHELVHVFQYGALGIDGFLTSFFGMSAATIAARWLARKPLRVMKSSPHEVQAYDLEARFKAWYLSTKGADPDHVTI